MTTRIGLSTSSVYPESTAHAFAHAAHLGYDAVEVMVGIDALSQQELVVGVYLADVAPEASGPKPPHLREEFRAKGPSNYAHGKQETM